jgi:hypothetical protein
MKELIKLIINSLAVLSSYVYILIMIGMYIFAEDKFNEIPTNEFVFFMMLAAIMILDKPNNK